MKGYRDIHAHILYGIDDGPRTRTEMEAMLDAAYADGVTSIFTTPHVTPGIYPMKDELRNACLEEARAYCRGKHYGMELHAGAEVMYTPALERYAVEGRLPTLADSDRVLLEFVPDISYREMEGAVELLERTGYSPVIAHIERCECMYRRNNAYRLKERYKVLYQVNCSTVLDGRGWLKDRQLKMWFTDEIIDFVASDSHDTRRRPSRMRAAHAALGLEYRKSYADMLVGLNIYGNTEIQGKNCS